MPRSLPAGMDPGTEELKYFQLFKVALVDGTILRYTDSDLDISHDVGDGTGIVTWDAASGISRKEIRAGIDLQIDDTEVTVPNINLTLGGLTRTIAHWARLRKFHGATVDIYIYDEANAKSALHSSWTIQGVASATTDQVSFLLESIVAKLDVQIPRRVIQPECNWALYDQFCGVDRALFKESVSVTSATIDSLVFTSPSASHAADYFDLGEILFTSGNLNGLRAMIGRSAITTPPSGFTIYLIGPLPEAPTPGTTFDVWPGCHKTLADCRDKFGSARTGAPTNWRQRYGGFPYVPSQDEVF